MHGGTFAQSVAVREVRTYVSTYKENTLRPAYIPAIAIVHTFLPVHV